jgi:glutathione S-transferase
VYSIPARLFFIWMRRPDVSSAPSAIERSCFRGCFSSAQGSGRFPARRCIFNARHPEQSAYAINRYRREVERHYRVLDDHLARHQYILGGEYSIVDMSAWGWLDRVQFVLPGSGDPLGPFPKFEAAVSSDGCPSGGPACSSGGQGLPVQARDG